VATVSTQPDSIEAVVERLTAIGHSLPKKDGVGYFNRLYLAVTEAVRERTVNRRFEDEAFLARLDVVFACLYLEAYEGWGAKPRKVPLAWRPLFHAREHAWRAPIQFALAGMSAHICHDLPLAVVRTCEEQGIAPEDDSPAHRDYVAVNKVLAQVEKEVKGWFLTGVLRDIDHDLGKLDDALAMWSISDARACAWKHAKTLWALRKHPHLSAAYLETLARLTDFTGRAMLI
jgi:hypothetical protein